MRALAGKPENELLVQTEPHVRLVAMMVHRGLVPEEEINKTVVNTASLALTRQLDASFSVDIMVEDPGRRWPWAPRRRRTG